MGLSIEIQSSMLQAVLSHYKSERDKVSAKLNLILNEGSNDIKNVLNDLTELFGELSKIEQIIKTIENIIESNNKQAKKMASELQNIQEQTPETKESKLENLK